MWYINRQHQQAFYRELTEKKKTLCPGSFNLYQDISMMMKSVQFNIDMSYREDRIELHSHAFYELVFVISGKVQYILDEKRIEVRPGDIIWIPPGIAHCPVMTELGGKEPYERKVMWLDRAFVSALQIAAENKLPMLDMPFITQLSPDNEETLSSLIQTGYESQKNDEVLSLLHRKIIASQIIYLYASVFMKPHKTRDPKEEVFDRVNKFITDNLAKDLSLEILCAQACLSTQALNTLFKNITGISAHQWVTRRRLMQARKLMSEGGIPTKIWEECGFLDYSGFYRAFNKLYGISPKEYMKIGV